MTHLRSAPITVPELWRRWVDRAAGLGLSPGDQADLSIAAFHAGAPETGPYRPSQVPAILAELEATARLARAAWRYAVFEGQLHVAADPEGLADDLASQWPGLLRELRSQRQAIRTAWIAQQATARLAAGDAIADVATALGVSRRTVERARSCDTSRLAMSLDIGDTGPTMNEMNRRTGT